MIFSTRPDVELTIITSLDDVVGVSSPVMRSCPVELFVAMVVVPEPAELPISVLTLPAVLMFTPPVPAVSVVVLVPAVLPSVTVLAPVIPVPREIVCTPVPLPIRIDIAPEPPIVTSPALAPVLIFVG